MKIDEFLRNKHGEKKMPQNIEVILNDLSVLREMVDDMYSYIYEHCIRNKVVSDLFISINEQIDVVVDDVKGE